MKKQTARLWVKVDPKDLPAEIKEAIKNRGEGETFFMFPIVEKRQGAGGVFTTLWRYYKQEVDGTWKRERGVWERSPDGKFEIYIDEEMKLFPSDTPPVKKCVPARIPIGNESFRQLEEIFGRWLTPGEREGEYETENGNVIERYIKKTQSAQLTFDFIKTPDEKKKKIPNIHEGTRQVLIAMMHFPRINPVGEYGARMSAGEYFELIGIRRPGGRDYDMLDNYFLTLAKGRVEYDNKRRGRDRIRWGISFVRDWEIIGERSLDTEYFWEFDPTVFSEITRAWSRGELTPALAKELGGYVSYPTAYLKNPLPQHLANIRFALLRHKWGSPVSMLHILRDWAKVKEDQLRKNDSSVRLCKKYLNQLQERGVIGKWKPTYKNKVGKLRKGATHPPLEDIAVVFSPPEKQIDLVLRASDQKHFDEILEWLTRKDPQTGKNIHGTHTRPARIRGQLENAVRTFGIKNVYAEYKKHGCGARPSPPAFWQALYPQGARGRPKSTDNRSQFDKQ